MELSRITSDCRQTCLQDQSEEMVGIRQEDAVGLCLCERQCAGDFPNTAHVVALVGVEWREISIRDESHWREELNTVDFPLRGERHHPVVKTIGAFLWRHVGDIGSAHTSGIICGIAAVVEPSLWKRILGAVDGAAWTRSEPSTGRHREQREKSQSGNNPWKGVGARISSCAWDSHLDGRSAAMTEFR